MNGPTAADLHLQALGTLQARINYLSQQVRVLQAENQRLRAEAEKREAPPSEITPPEVSPVEP